MRPLRLLLILFLLGLAVAPALAQPSPPDTPVPADEAAITAIEAAARADRAEDAARTAGEAADEAQKGVELGFNLLGLFEALSLVVTLVGALLVGLGLVRLFSAQSELQKAREGFERETREARELIQQLTVETQERFETLRRDLSHNADSATLALSYLPLGERQYKFRDYTGALDFYHRALSLDADNPIIHFRIGYVYTQSGRLKEAEHYLRLALEKEPDFAPALAALGYVYRRMGEKMDRDTPERDILLNRAEGLLLQALNASPKLVDEDGESWWGSLGGLYRRRSQTDEAIRAYRQAADVVPQSSYASSNLALLYAERADRARMIETYRRVEELAYGEVQADPDNYWAWADLLTARLALNKPEAAEDALRQAFTTAPIESPYALDSLNDTLERLLKALEGEQAARVQRYMARIREFAAEQARQRSARAAPPEGQPASAE